LINKNLYSVVFKKYKNIPHDDEFVGGGAAEELQDTRCSKSITGTALTLINKRNNFLSKKKIIIMNLTWSFTGGMQELVAQFS